MNGTWTPLEVGGKSADVYAPRGDERPRFGLLYLHDVDGRTLAGRTELSRLLDELGMACVCPHGGPCWWADRVCPAFDTQITPERYLLDRVVPFFGERWGLEPRALGLLGVGMGGQGALRLAFKHPKRFAVVAALGAALDHHELYFNGTALDEMYDSKEQCRQDTALLHVHPSDAPPHLFFACDPDDDWYRGNDRLHEKLGALGVAHEADFAPAATPGDYLNRLGERALRFVHAGLVQQSRRLL